MGDCLDTSSSQALLNRGLDVLDRELVADFRKLGLQGRLAVSEIGETIHRVTGTTSVSSDGTTYTRMGSTTVCSDGSTFTQMGCFSSDGSTRMGRSATGLGAVFNEQDDF